MQPVHAFWGFELKLSAFTASTFTPWAFLLVPHFKEQNSLWLWQWFSWLESLDRHLEAFLFWPVEKGGDPGQKAGIPWNTTVLRQKPPQQRKSQQQPCCWRTGAGGWDRNPGGVMVAWSRSSSGSRESWDLPLSRLWKIKGKEPRMTRGKGTKDNYWQWSHSRWSDRTGEDERAEIKGNVQHTLPRGAIEWATGHGNPKLNTGASCYQHVGNSGGYKVT